MMAPTKATWAAGKMFNAAEGGVWRHDIIGAAEYRRRWLLGKYSTSPKVAFGATKLWELLKSRRSDARNCMGTNQGGDGYCKKYSTLPKTVLIYSWRRRRPAGAVLKNSSIRKKKTFFAPCFCVISFLKGFLYEKFLRRRRSKVPHILTLSRPGSEIAITKPADRLVFCGWVCGWLFGH